MLGLNERRKREQSMVSGPAGQLVSWWQNTCWLNRAEEKRRLGVIVTYLSCCEFCFVIREVIIVLERQFLYGKITVWSILFDRCWTWISKTGITSFTKASFSLSYVQKNILEVWIHFFVNILPNLVLMIYFLNLFYLTPIFPILNLL